VLFPNKQVSAFGDRQATNEAGEDEEEQEEVEDVCEEEWGVVTIGQQQRTPHMETKLREP
jgi:hypothetical protein